MTPLGDGHGPAPSKHKATKFLLSDEIQMRVASLLQLHAAELEALESPVERVKAAMLIAGPFLEMAAPYANLLAPGLGTELSDVLRKIEGRINA